MIKYIFGLIVFCAVALLVWGVFQVQHTPALTAERITVGSNTLAVDVADTPAKRQQGLSGRESLVQGSGMLFVFPQAGKWGFWMKDMRFAIDIIWADDDGVIVTIWPNVTPNTYPKVFYPHAPARYVLEVPAGYAATAGIGVGQKIVVQYKERVE